jgi:hypothetical protein
MNFKFDDKDYDSDKLSEQGKIYLDKLQNIFVRKNQLANEYSDIQVLEKHYAESLKSELPKEEKEVKEEIKEETK